MRRSIVGDWLQRRAAKHAPEARLEKWTGMRLTGIILLLAGLAAEIVPAFFQSPLLRALLLGVGIPVFIVGLIITIVFSAKISELKRINPGLGQQPSKEGEHRVAQRIPKTQTSAGLERDQVEKLKALFKVSEKVRIDDIASMLGTSRKDAFDKLLVLSKTVNFQISEDVVIVNKGQTDALISELDKQYAEWGTKEQTKSGKI
jgi:hypothetical protein